MLRTALRGVDAIGGAVDGKYDVTPEIPTQVSETDLSRLDATNRELMSRVIDLGSLLNPKPLPSVAAHPLAIPPLPRGARVTGIGANGPIIEGLQGRPQEAFGWLNDARTGDVKGLINHPELPGRPIDVVYGDQAMGLAHVVGKHPGDIDTLPSRWSGLKLVSNEADKAKLRSPEAQAVVAKDFSGEPKDWLITYFDPRGRLGDRGGNASPPPTYKGPVGPPPFLPVSKTLPWAPFGWLPPAGQQALYGTQPEDGQ